jgi:hypothetical protein
LNNKLDRLRASNKSRNNPQTTQPSSTNKITHTEQSRGDIFPFYNKLLNLTYIKFNRDEINILQRGPQYNLETEPENWKRDIAIDTETAISYLERSQQDTFRRLAYNKIHKILQETEAESALHKREKYTIKQIRRKLQATKASIALADKGKTIVIIHIKDYNCKINYFLTENNFHIVHKDSTDKF